VEVNGDKMIENSKKRSWGVLCLSIIFLFSGISGFAGSMYYFIHPEKRSSIDESTKQSIDYTIKNFDQMTINFLDPKSEWYQKLKDSEKLQEFQERSTELRKELIIKCDRLLKRVSHAILEITLSLFVGGVVAVIAGLGLFMLKPWAIKMCFISIGLSFLYNMQALYSVYLTIIQWLENTNNELGHLVNPLNYEKIVHVPFGKTLLMQGFLKGVYSDYDNIFLILFFIVLYFYFGREKVRSQFK